MKFLFWIPLALWSLAPLGIHPAKAQPRDEICFWQRPDGQFVDLSELCGQSNSATGLSPEDAFLSAFQQQAQQYPETVQRSLNTYVTQEQNSALASAQAACRVLQYGGVEAAQRRLQALASYNNSASATARQNMTQSLAIAHLCPEFSDS